MGQRIRISPGPLRGKVQIPPSKSDSHRAIIAAALAAGESHIKGVLLSDDIVATTQAMSALGATIAIGPEKNHLVDLTISGCANPQAHGITVDCGESGSTIRFLLPVLALDAANARVTGRGRLGKRPLTPYYDVFAAFGVEYIKEADDSELPLVISGSLSAGDYTLPGDVSSQFITGLLFALPLLSGDSRLTLSTPLESKPYVDITLKVLADFGIEIINEDYRSFLVPGKQSYRARDYRVEGDFSQGAFFMVAGSIGETVACTGLDHSSTQGDQVIVDFMREMSGAVEEIEDGYAVHPRATKGITANVSDCPDLVPVFSVLAALSGGTTEIVGGARLRLKESDRIAATVDMLTSLGAEARETDDGLIITGGELLDGGEVSGHNDHRIVMAAAIASICCQQDVIIDGWEAVNKSYPHFFDDFRALGGKAHVLDL